MFLVWSLEGVLAVLVTGNWSKGIHGSNGFDSPTL